MTNNVENGYGNTKLLQGGSNFYTSKNETNQFFKNRFIIENLRFSKILNNKIHFIRKNRNNVT